MTDRSTDGPDSVDAPTVREQIRQARGKFVAMVGTYSLGAFNDNFFKQAAILLAVDAGMKDLRGTALVLFSLPFILLAAPAGWLADRFAKRHIVIATKLLELAAMICGAVGIWTGSWPLILTMVCLMGAQSALFSPALNGSIPELYPASYVVRANAHVKIAVTAAILLGVSAAGVLELDELGSLFGVPAGRAVVAGLALLVALIGVGGSFGVPHRPPANPRAEFPWTGPLDTLHQWRLVGRDRLLTITLLGDVFIWFIGSLQLLQVVVLGLEQFHFGKGWTAALSGSEMIGVAIGGVLAGRLARGRRWYRVLAPSLIALAALMLGVWGVGFLPEGTHLIALLVLLGAAGVPGGMVMISCEAFIQVRPAPERKGEVIAAANCAAFLGILLAGAVSIPLGWWFDPTTSFALLAGPTFAVAVALWWALRREDHRD